MPQSPKTVVYLWIDSFIYRGSESVIVIQDMQTHDCKLDLDFVIESIYMLNAPSNVFDRIHGIIIQSPNIQRFRNDKKFEDLGKQQILMMFGNIVQNLGRETSSYFFLGFVLRSEERRRHRKEDKQLGFLWGSVLKVLQCSLCLLNFVPLFPFSCLYMCRQITNPKTQRELILHKSI